MFGCQINFGALVALKSWLLQLYWQVLYLKPQYQTARKSLSHVFRRFLWI